MYRSPFYLDSPHPQLYIQAPLSSLYSLAPYTCCMQLAPSPVSFSIQRSGMGTTQYTRGAAAGSTAYRLTLGPPARSISVICFSNKTHEGQKCVRLCSSNFLTGSFFSSSPTAPVICQIPHFILLYREIYIYPYFYQRAHSSYYLDSISDIIRRRSMLKLNFDYLFLTYF